MTRGSYSTPASSNRRPPAADLTVSDPRTYIWHDYGHTNTSSITPSEFLLPVLAAQLADKWLEVARENGQSMQTLTASVRRFLTHVGSQPRAADRAQPFGLGDLRRRHLDAWEMDLLAAHREAKTDTHYRYAVYLFALLDRIQDDTPEVLHPEVVRRLESDTRLRHHRNEGLPAFAPAEVRHMRSRAHRLVYGHLRLGADGKPGPAPPPPPPVLVAAHILLSLATGEPPEVIRALKVDDVTATAPADYDQAVDGMTPAARLAWLAERNLIDHYAVTWTKNRARESYQDVYTRHDHAAHRALTALIRLTAPLRARSNLSALWQQEQASGRITQPVWNSDLFRIRHWVDESGLVVSEPQVWGRFRKTVVAGEALANPRRYLNSKRRHRAETFFRHYTNSEVLRAEAGRLLLESANEMFEASLAGPTVVTPEAEQLLAAGQEAPGLDAATAAALLRGDLDGPQAACRDSRDSPFEALGDICTRSMTGTCFGCGNALITRHHLPAALAIAEVADPARAADPQVWLDHWKPIYEMITQMILPAFPPEDVEAARRRMASVPLDLGTRNDMRGTDDEA
ncbi:hypothetical protein [Arthrobacter sp. VKM Ac-2550]|uniref:hypothetical protein n=1 Tax=Crystallibacter permensis TaxID=1938888 RepID=UPI0022278C92|nr:hypothetical protein [Arthrobacter sp. VKM Ac-2550]MCW2132713.1 hypothetical protein [Arthrobacter sp. VKM Ac-2550]